MAKPNTIQDRIAKLLAVANSAPDSPEGQIAMRKAMLWLAQANMTLEQFEGSNQEVKIGELRWENFTNRPWARQVASSISKLYFCKVLFFTGSKKITVAVIGKKENTEVAYQVCSWVIDSISKQARKSCDTTQGQNSFKAYASVAVRENVKRIMDEESKTDIVGETGKSLVLASIYKQADAQATEYMDSKYRTKALTSKPKVSDQAAAMEGYRYGKTINLNKQIEK